MKALRRAWAAWRGLWSGEEAPYALVAVRVLLGLTILADLFEVWRMKLIVGLWGPCDAGGMGCPDKDPTPVELYRWFAPTVHTTHHAFMVLVVATACFTVGWLAQPAALVALVILAQFAEILPPADRGIDMLVRNVLLLYVFVPSGRALGVDARIFGRLERMSAWPRRLLCLQLVVVYFTAGIQKTAVAWWPWGGFSALFIVLQDMAVARIPFAWLAPWYPLTQLATAGTMVFELGAVLVPLALVYRNTRTRPGWLRAQLNRTGFLHKWLAVGVLLHLGIAATMHLGIFPWAMLALYPCLFHPDELLRGVRRVRREFGWG